MHDGIYIYIPLYIFPGNTCLAVWERDETGPVSGLEMLIARCFEGTWGCLGGVKVKFPTRRGKIAPFGKSIDIIVVISLFMGRARMYNL